MRTFYDSHVERMDGANRLIGVASSLKEAQRQVDEYLPHDPQARLVTIRKRTATLRRENGAPCVYGNAEGTIVYRLRVNFS